MQAKTIVPKRERERERERERGTKKRAQIIEQLDYNCFSFCVPQRKFSIKKVNISTPKIYLEKVRYTLRYIDRRKTLS
jgi:hypothetical protein